MRTEREKMLAGELYNPRDPELVQQLAKARRLTAQLLATPWEDTEARTAILRELLGHAGANVWIETPFFCDFGNNISLGDNSFINANCVFLDCATITIGRNVLIAPSVQLYAVTHPLSVAERVTPNWRGPEDERPPYWDYGKPISIGDNAWIGGASVVLPGVSIGEGSVIGAGSVVTRDVPPGVLACGNPCRVVRKI